MQICDGSIACFAHPVPIDRCVADEPRAAQPHMARLHLLSGIRLEGVASAFRVSLSTVIRAVRRLPRGGGDGIPAAAPGFRTGGTGRWRESGSRGVAGAVFERQRSGASLAHTYELRSRSGGGKGRRVANRMRGRRCVRNSPRRSHPGSGPHFRSSTPNERYPPREQDRGNSGFLAPPAKRIPAFPGPGEPAPSEPPEPISPGTRDPVSGLRSSHRTGHAGRFSLSPCARHRCALRARHM